jgi:uncharacterized membrane protein
MVTLNMQQITTIDKSLPGELGNMQLLTSPKESRFRAFDLARGIAIITMVTIHSIVFVGEPALTSTIAGLFCNVIISLLAAPVFMFVMGALFSFSSKTSLKTQLLRGLSILLIGYVLNLFRGTIPVAAGQMFGWITEDLENPLKYLLEDDILEFAGLALITVALVKRFLPWKLSWIILGGIVAFGSPLVWNRGCDQPALHYVLSLFTGSEEYNYFPFFPWITFPLFGMAYGAFFKASKDKNTFFKTTSILGVILITAGVLMVLSGDDIWKRWYIGKFRQGKLPISIITFFIGFQCIWLFVCNKITMIVPKNQFFDKLYFWSKNVTSFYNIQWLIIGWVCVMFPLLEWPAIIICIVAVTFFTDKFIQLYLKSKSAA